MSEAKGVSGTKEWSTKSDNFQTGCKNNCRECFAAEVGHRRGYKDREDWENAVIRDKDVRKGRKKNRGTVMLPTTHDVDEDNIEQFIIVLRKHMEVGNDVLIVSKPRLACIKRICAEFKDYADQILFRFTIGSMNDEVLKFWNPGAPNYKERVDALEHAYEHGFKTSISSEPFYDDTIVPMFHELAPLITDSHWIGKMNKKGHVVTEKEAKKFSKKRIIKLPDGRLFHRERVFIEGWTETEWGYWNAVEAIQTDEMIWEIYNLLKDESLVKWKESIKKIVGIEVPTKAGQDI